MWWPNWDEVSGFISVCKESYRLLRNWRSIAQHRMVAPVLARVGRGVDRIRGEFQQQWQQFRALSTAGKSFVAAIMLYYFAVLAWDNVVEPADPPLAVSGPFSVIVLALVGYAFYRGAKRVVCFGRRRI